MWKIRHQGSPQQVENLTLQQVVEGLQDGRWALTDEVMGPKDQRWVPIENHPQLAEVVEELEVDHPTPQVDEAHLDMNALIDVCMVLLIFFMLTITYTALEKILDMPLARREGVRAALVNPEEARARMIQVEISKKANKPIIRVEGEVVNAQKTEDLARVLRKTRKNEVLIRVQNGRTPDEQVDWGTVVQVISAAGEAHIERVHFDAGKPPVQKKAG